MGTVQLAAANAFSRGGFAHLDPKKGCGQPLGESWPRAIRSGTGRGGDV